MGSWTAGKFRSCIEELDVIYRSGGWDEPTRQPWRPEAPMVPR